MTLFPWPAQVYDRDVSSSNNNNSASKYVYMCIYVCVCLYMCVCMCASTCVCVFVVTRSNCYCSLKDEDVNSYDKMKTLRSETQTYYQVLIDQRDFPYIVNIT